MVDIETVLNEPSGIVLSSIDNSKELIFSSIFPSVIAEADIILNDLTHQKQLFFKQSQLQRIAIDHIQGQSDPITFSIKKDSNNSQDHSFDFQYAKTLINENILSKMVVYSQSNYQCLSQITRLDILKKLLKNNFGQLYIVWTKDFTLFGRTPETLVHIDSQKISFDTLAGTTQGVFSKNHFEENNWVEKHLRQIALKYSLDLDDESIGEKEHGKIKHLYKRLSAPLPSKISKLQFLEDLAPTPALGSFPKEKFSYLFQETQYSKKIHPHCFYGGNLSIKTTDTFNSIVLIRGATLIDSMIYINAGGGIVSSSNWEEEKKEIELKKEFIYDILTN